MLLIHSSNDSCLGCFQLSVFVNYGTMNMDVHISVQSLPSILFVYTQKWEMRNHMAILGLPGKIWTQILNFLQELPYCFSD